MLSAQRIIQGVLSRINQFLFWLRGGGRYGQEFYNPVLLKAIGGIPRRSHISDHLSTIFFFAVDARPELMVELGTRSGESTRVLLAAASITQSKLLSIDRDDCGGLDLPFKNHWHFVQSDDVEFGKTGFADWCAHHEMPPQIDLLFIDTSHWYEHTKKEIEIWSPFLSLDGTIILHDTNMGKGPYARMDGSIGFGYDNERGVIKLVEEMFNRSYDEKSFFSDLSKGFMIMHHPHCNGLTVLKKYAPAESVKRSLPN